MLLYIINYTSLIIYPDIIMHTYTYYSIICIDLKKYTYHKLLNIYNTILYHNYVFKSVYEIHIFKYPHFGNQPLFFLTVSHDICVCAGVILPGISCSVLSLAFGVCNSCHLYSHCASCK